MSTTTTTVPRILCPECRRENEAERVYCHDCGARLDRTAVKAKKEPVQDTHKRVQRMFDPHRAKLKAFAVSFGKLLFAAGLVALIVDIALPPDVPAPSKKPILTSSIRIDLESMLAKHQPPLKEITDEQANAFLASALHSKQANLEKPLLNFKRAVVLFHEQRCAVSVQRALLGYWSLYTTCVYSPTVSNGKLTAKIEGGYIGRLPVHPKIAQHMGVLLGDVASALGQDMKLVAKTGGIELHEKTVTLKAP
jgi:hypothetical protein